MTVIDKITLVSGDSVHLNFTLTDSAGDPLEPSVEGLTIEWEALHIESGTLVVGAIADISSASNVATVRIPPDTLTLVGRWRHEIQLSDADRKYTPARGYIDVVDDIVD